MTVVATIRTVSMSKTDTTSTLNHSYHILDDDGGVVSFDAAIAAMPSLGGKITIEDNQHEIISVAVDAVEASIGNVWSGSISAVYEIGGIFIPKDLNTTAINLEVWRAAANAPNNLNSPNDSDIGGTKMDQQGEPISMILPLQELTITNIRADNNAEICRAATGKRNSADWNGATSGYVLFVGAQAKRISEAEYEITYKFVYDAFAHCRQVPKRGHDGRVDCTDGKATTVMWRQPFPNTYNFNAMDIEL